ncbi:alpha-amylase family protein [Porphyromonas canoris]|uniref:alpha-amylase family protein n=1 Tax=Porphyromonas canoris TaxID=36875 RepID=UPI00068DDB85|nr:alpha-amylase family protein [Porphyromonas canoris]
MSISIYQLLPRIWGNTSQDREPNGDIRTNGCGKFNDISAIDLQSIKKLGITHIWYTGILEHATQTSYSEFGIAEDNPCIVKGKAGSPYAVKDYYDVDPDLAEKVPQRMQEFESLVSRTHDAGLKVIIDFVPNHVARQYVSDAKPENCSDFGEKDDTDLAFSLQNNFYYIPGQPLSLQHISRENGSSYSEFPAKATGNDCFVNAPSSGDWYETVKLNYGVDYANGRCSHFSPIPDTWSKMLEILLFWSSKGVDGFRCDMAEMVPLEFWKWCIERVKSRYPNTVFIAEIYSENRYEEFIQEGGFDYLYDKVGLYDCLISILKKRASTSAIKDIVSRQHSISSHLLRFMENHDEQRLASDFISSCGENAFPAMVVSTLVDNSAVMTYFAQELGEKGMDAEGFSGQDGRTTIFDYWSLPKLQKWKADRDGEDQNTDKILREKYKILLNAKTDRKVFSSPHYYDLNHILPLPAQEKNEVALFLRWDQSNPQKIAIVAANFSHSPISTKYEIPKDALDMMGLQNRSIWSVEMLLSGKKTTYSISESIYLPLQLQPYEANIIVMSRIMDKN